mgnify:CR=1 FL=1
MDCKKKVDKQATGLRLYHLIENSGYTREEIAFFLELNSPRVIYDWLNGTKLPSIEHLLNLAKLLKVHIEDILVI